jgi:hypothetical protein
MCSSRRPISPPASYQRAAGPYARAPPPCIPGFLRRARASPRSPRAADRALRSPAIPTPPRLMPPASAREGTPSPRCCLTCSPPGHLLTAGGGPCPYLLVPKAAPIFLTGQPAMGLPSRSCVPIRRPGALPRIARRRRGLLQASPSGTVPCHSRFLHG